jgi:radical SAM superfamily enzyme YgiQ (UPF0313 family)
MPQDFNLPFVDLACIGEGVNTLRETVQALEKGDDFEDVPGLALFRNGEINFTSTRESVNDLDSLPFPARHLTARYRSQYYRGTWKPHASIMTSRGCPYRCKFCAVWRTEGGRYRVRSASKVVEELRLIEQSYISISDDNFLHDVRRAEDICEMLVSEGIQKRYRQIGRADTIVRHPDLIRKWRDAGMEIMLVGFEDIRNSGLRKLNKRTTADQNREAIRILHDLNIIVSAHFIVSQDFSEDDFQRLGDFVQEMELRHPVFCILTPLPGTVFFEQVHNQIDTNNYELFDLTHTVLPTELERDIFYNNYINLYRKAYMTQDPITRIPVTKRTISKALTEFTDTLDRERESIWK